jgi:starch phosphorylase
MDRYVPLPPLPDRISRLNELAYDLWWSWNPQAREVFRDLDYPLWRFTDHNPVLLLHLVEPERLEHAAADPAFLSLYDEAISGLDLVRAGSGTWWSQRAQAESQPVAWITPEFALHQSLPMDASAVGVLAGDFCKEASDLGVPLVGVGLMYPRGYAHQRVSAEGWQQETYEYIDWSDAPIGPALTPDGSRCRFMLPIGTTAVHVAVWQVRAGRVTIFLLDTDLPENEPWDRELSSKYIVEDPEACLRQSMLLGRAAVRALALLGVDPAMWHVAEGAAATVALERLHGLVASGTGLDDALSHVRQTTVFATRDAAPARRESFSFGSLERHVSAAWPALEPHREAVLALGHHDTDRGPVFNVSVLGARASATMNVPESAARERASALWEGVRGPRHGTTGPVHAIADGVHVSTWISADLSRLFDRCIGEDWHDRQDDPAAWEAIRALPDEDAWAVRQRLRRYLLDFVRDRARRKWAREQASGNRLAALGTLLDADTLTIGFARRFSASARPELVFEDVERLARIVTEARRPVQIVFAGKAHPGDEIGKHHLQRIFRHTLDPKFGGRIAFLEGYDLHVARLLVQGCDVWLSTPRRGSPVSIGGLKAAVNGVAHLATPDAWGYDGCSGRNGWLIDGGRTGDPAAQDAADARALYSLLEDTIVPAFYDRDRTAIPLQWTAIMKESIAFALPHFCARRAVKAFAEAAYQPAVGSRK